ncbi:MAG: bifunctional hydroxymethylpyrimidine kinase/phosphomethylpyrimidine kinase [Candidatus Bathyarchaeota archaeon]
MSKNLRKKSSALTVAGIDSCGGAGITADLKTFAALETYGACVVTALTAQNTKNIYELLPIPPKLVEGQLKAIFRDMHIVAAKTGVLFSSENIRVVAKHFRKYDLKIVVDPVLKAGTGVTLIDESALQAYVKELLPLATILTPNVPEAEKFTQMRIKSLSDMKNAAQKISELGVNSIIIKGGHIKGELVTDVFLKNGNFKIYRKPRLSLSLHGGGCCFSAAIAAFLTYGLRLDEAVDQTENFMQGLFNFSLTIGEGKPVANPLAYLHITAEKNSIVQNILSSITVVKKNEKKFLPYIADVGTQIAMSLPHPFSLNHVAAIEGRIKRDGKKIHVGGPVKFGVSTHMANVILACALLDSKVSAVMNVHYDRNLVVAFKKAGLTVSSFDRKFEPKKMKEIEGSTLRWGVEQAIKDAKVKMLDAIYDQGDVDKEPMIRVLGKDALDVVFKTLAAIKRLT